MIKTSKYWFQHRIDLKQQNPRDTASLTQSYFLFVANQSINQSIHQTINQLIYPSINDTFPSYLFPLFQNPFDQHENEHVGGAHIPTNGSTRGLVLTQKRKVTRFKSIKGHSVINYNSRWCNSGSLSVTQHYIVFYRHGNIHVGVYIPHFSLS